MMHLCKEKPADVWQDSLSDEFLAVQVWWVEAWFAALT